MRQAERVSPTNVGLLLNARQAALEFGYLTLGEFTHLTTQTLSTVERMPKYRGHLFNWHSTQTLEIMHPLMVTTVDSGNLAGSFISLRMGCRELLEQPMICKDLLSGLRDHLQVLESLGVSWPGRIINLEDKESDADWIDTLLRLGTSLQLTLEPTADAEAKWWGQPDRTTRRGRSRVRTAISAVAYAGVQRDSANGPARSCGKDASGHSPQCACPRR